ncbi:microsomal triacylglycerol transfer protein [Bicyclus anynana]|uniref:Microsomal triacylglycerol transfer protein n=1 Tax=Bicyclus anynana TaxID=110368 RepID=A0ABM3LWS1_BICAN|nr:microsomal triacylglycerol transfer protein [Bicyclus anynana]
MRAAALLLLLGALRAARATSAVPPGAPAAYAVDATTLLNAAERRDREVSHKVLATLRVLPAWAAGRELLLRLELAAPRLHARGKHANAEYRPVESLWDSLPLGVFYAHFERGLVRAAYLDPAEPLDVQNFKRSLLSVLQFQEVEGLVNETDVSGECEVQYETFSEDSFRKIKRGCVCAGWGAADEVRSRRAVRYSLAEGELRELYADELHELGEAAAGAGLKARAFLRLTREQHAPAAPARAASLAAALAALPAALRASPLAAQPPDHLADDEDQVAAPTDEELSAAARDAAGGAPGLGGSLRAARAALLLLAARARLPALLHDGADAEQLAGALAALGLAGGAADHRAAVAFLRLRQRDAPRALAHAYFAALAQAERPHDAAAEDALRLADELADDELRESALLAGAAAAARASPAAAAAAHRLLARSLAACAHDECRRVCLAALGNLRRAEAAELLLRHAAGGGAAAGAALDALDALLTARGALPAACLAPLERAALGAGALEARAAALDLLLRAAAPAPFGLPRVLLALRGAPAELRRLAWQRLRALAAEGEPVRLLLRLLPAELRGWDAQAPGGTSSLLVRELARGAGWRAALESRQVASGALLRRGRVRLLVLSPANRTDDTVTVELWTRGLGALAGGAAEGDAGGEAEEAGAGLALGVGGARLRELPLFRGQAELLGHVWTGTGSEPTPVLRALRPLAGARAALPLLGGAALRYRRAALLAAALDADATVSLWARTARARLALRVALAARAEASARAAWGALAAHAAAELEPRVRVDADLDFYDGVALCVRAHTAAHDHARNVTLTSRLGAPGRRVRRSRATRLPLAGRTLALGAPNDATCRAMGARGD